jgi:hypothetical protein
MEGTSNSANNTLADRVLDQVSPLVSDAVHSEWRAYVENESLWKIKHKEGAFCIYTYVKVSVNIATLFVPHTPQTLLKPSHSAPWPHNSKYKAFKLEGNLSSRYSDLNIMQQILNTTDPNVFKQW